MEIIIRLEFGNIFFLLYVCIYSLGKVKEKGFWNNEGEE